MTSSVLYVEDNAANIRLITRILSLRPEIDLRIAMTGRDGMRQAELIQPDLILLDLGLPDIDGYEVLMRLKALPASAAVPVVVISGYAAPADIAKMLELGADGFLAKPFDLDELISVIDKFCAQPVPT
jgi:CheY-like chemotaxis protein